MVQAIKSSGEFVVPSSTYPLTGKELTLQGEWKGKTAGGCLNHQTWRFNPQIFLTVTKPSKVAITISQEGKTDLAAIGFYVFKSKDPFKRLVTLPEDPEAAIEGKTPFIAQNKGYILLLSLIYSLSSFLYFTHTHTHTIIKTLISCFDMLIFSEY
jgi:hypothetical protein